MSIICTVGLVYLWLKLAAISIEMATTMTLMGIVAAQAGAVLCCRSDRSALCSVLDYSAIKLVLVGIGTELLVLLVLIYVPFMQDIFNTAAVGRSRVVFCTALGTGDYNIR
jgi:Ca2+-transporting ATPase